jgi:putative inorganic carbon (HCO3(-)) transporter
MLYACLLLYVAVIYIRPAEIFPGWSMFPFVDVLSGVAAVVAVFSLGVTPRRFLNAPHDKFILAFWAFITLSGVTVWFWTMYDGWLQFTPVIFAYFLIRMAVQTKRQLHGLVYLLIFMNVFLAINGIVQYHTGIGLGEVPMTLDRIYGTGIFNDPNDLGMTFVMVVPFIMMLIGRRETGLIVRALFFAALAIILVALYYTNSRGAVIGLAAAMIAYSFMNFRPIKAWVVAAILLGVITIAAPSRAGEIDFQESSAQSRIQSWAEGWAMLKSSPLIGVGYNQFTEYNDAVAHNSFVHTFAELGLAGAFCFVGMFYWYFKGLKVGHNASKEVIAWNRAMIVSGTGTLACVWFLSRQYVPPLYLMLAIGGCAALLQRPVEDQDLRTGSRDAFNIGMLTICGVLLVYFSIRTMAVWSGM